MAAKKQATKNTDNLIEENKQEKVNQEPQVRRKKQIDLNLEVPVRNVHDGEVIYVSRKTGLQTLWNSYGDEVFMDVGELLTMKASQSRFLNEPWIIIDDEDVAKYLGLDKLYEKLIGTEELDQFFELTVGEMEEILNKIPKGMKESISIRARRKFEDETLYDNRKIRLLQDKLKIDLNILR
jgi:hypothetical protein